MNAFLYPRKKNLRDQRDLREEKAHHPNALLYLKSFERSTNKLLQVNVSRKFLEVCVYPNDVSSTIYLIK